MHPEDRTHLGSGEVSGLSQDASEWFGRLDVPKRRHDRHGEDRASRSRPAPGSATDLAIRTAVSVA